MAECGCGEAGIRGRSMCAHFQVYFRFIEGNAALLDVDQALQIRICVSSFLRIQTFVWILHKFVYMTTQELAGQLAGTQEVTALGQNIVQDIQTLCHSQPGIFTLYTYRFCMD